ncbi:D-TA family PLP-dependent enzyme [Nitratireductor basaltis]|uniref:Alanine racemase domain-containing protein n=1 Tax=Nitratireductor basaltis TaxID=472175 RepID=A0A084U6H1_9HYPH|nr:D-TA family PLP-dependent enzyme [Nitratireductor basaltis]KFB08557.1 Alanine racemase domain-containing protein [Nitratireductor basaltis]
MRITDLETPAVVIDRAKVEANLARAQAYADQHGFKLRPHIKTHKLPILARRQVELGAIGITCQKLGEAEVMADGGLEDIFIPYNILGEAKLARLAALHERIRVSVTADSLVTIDGYAGHFTDPDHALPVLIECDTGMGRCGVQDVEEVVALAKRIAGAPGLRFQGLMTYPPRGRALEVEAWLQRAVEALEAEGLSVELISNGGTPDMYEIAGITTATEYRPGTYVYSDRMQVAFGHRTLEDCALTVLAQVVSRPTDDRAVIDAGSKALAADIAPVPGHGHVVGYPEAVITTLSEEHGVIDLSECSRKPEIGEKLHIIPNHVCVVSNLFDEVNLVEGDDVVETLPVAARGRLS